MMYSNSIHMNTVVFMTNAGLRALLYRVRGRKGVHAYTLRPRQARCSHICTTTVTFTTFHCLITLFAPVVTLLLFSQRSPSLRGSSSCSTLALLHVHLNLADSAHRHGHNEATEPEGKVTAQHTARAPRFIWLLCIRLPAVGVSWPLDSR